MPLNTPFKTIVSETTTGECKVYGNGHYIETKYKVPDWKEDEHNPDPEDCFTYKGETYFLSQFMTINKDSPFYLLDDEGNTLFDGYHSDSFFSGILVKYHEFGDAVKAYTYIS